MDRRILFLAAASFATGTEAYVYAGHLTALAADLDQPVATAGQLASAFALTYALTAPFVAGFAGRFGRRGVIVTGLVVIGLLNCLAALASSFEMLIAIRFACGLAAGLVGPITSLAAAELAPPQQRGRAMAVVLAGITLAFVLGIPTGSVVGDFAGWRGTFVYAGLLALGAAVLIRTGLPSLPGGVPLQARAFKAALQPAVALPLLLTLTGFAATFTVIAYVGPIVTAISGLTGSGIGAMQALIGVGSIAGIVLGGRAADRPETRQFLAASFLVSVFALSGYSALMSVDAQRSSVIALLSLAMLTGAGALFARTPVIQTRLVTAAPVAARPVVLALNGSMMFAGQGLGAAIGGAVIAGAGIGFAGYAAGAVAAVGALLAFALLRPSPTAGVSASTKASAEIGS
jgi:DHA1 family inner membrane transport protein